VVTLFSALLVKLHAPFLAAETYSGQAEMEAVAWVIILSHGGLLAAIAGMVLRDAHLSWVAAHAEQQSLRQAARVRALWRAQRGVVRLQKLAAPQPTSEGPLLAASPLPALGVSVLAAASQAAWRFGRSTAKVREAAAAAAAVSGPPSGSTGAPPPPPVHEGERNNEPFWWTEFSVAPALPASRRKANPRPSKVTRKTLGGANTVRGRILYRLKFTNMEVAVEEELNVLGEKPTFVSK
jgi:hypothetical protein